MRRPRYKRQRPSSRDEVLTRVRAELGEHFEDFLVVARSRNPDQIRFAMSDQNWAAGAMDNMLRKISES